MVFFVDGRNRWVGDFTVSAQRGDVSISNITPRFTAKDASVSFDGKNFVLRGGVPQEDIIYDLEFSPRASPISSRGPELGVFGAKLDGREELIPLQSMKVGVGVVAKGWVSVPRAAVRGTVTFGSTRVEIRRGFGYHDHNWGKFRWGDSFGWDGGVALGAASPSSPELTVGFLFDRSSTAIKGREGGVFILGPSGFKRVFVAEETSFSESGVFQGPYRRLPGTEAVLYPDSVPACPERISVSCDKLGKDKNARRTKKSSGDWLHLVYTPSSLCELSTVENNGVGKTSWVETFGEVRLNGELEGIRFSTKTALWMESVRSRR